jgi:hypothetical protein
MLCVCVSTFVREENNHNQERNENSDDRTIESMNTVSETANNDEDVEMEETSEDDNGLFIIPRK